MSYTELYGVTKKGNFKLVNEFENASLGGLWIWKMLFDKYLKKEEYFNESFKKIWDLIKSPELKEYEKIVLCSTFDYFVLKPEDIDEFVAALEIFINEFKDSEGLLNPNLSKQIQEIKKLKKYSKYIGYVYNQSSVGSIDDKNKYLENVYFSFKTALKPNFFK